MKLGYGNTFGVNSKPTTPPPPPPSGQYPIKNKFSKNQIRTNGGLAHYSVYQKKRLQKMKWRETTDKKNPLSCRGEYCLDIPWLEHTTNGGLAYYSVTKDISGEWYSMFWHGNRGHSVCHPHKTEFEAKLDCLVHLKRMYSQFSVQINLLWGSEK